MPGFMIYAANILILNGQSENNLHRKKPMGELRNIHQL